MNDQPRLEPLEASEVFPYGRGSRHPPEGTVFRGYTRGEIVNLSEHMTSGTVNGDVADDLPPEMQRRYDLHELLERGRQRYGIYCVHCHDLLGTGNGLVPQRGYPFPPTYHSERLRSVPLGHIFQVISDGRGRMPAHRNQIPPPDRWAIAAYVRALQLSQRADVSQLPQEDVEALNRLRQKGDAGASPPVQEGGRPAAEGQETGAGNGTGVPAND